MRARIVVPILAVLAIVAAACTTGGGDTTTTTTATTAPPSSTTTTQGTTTTAAVESAQTELTIGLQLEPPSFDLTATPAAAIPQVLLYNVYEGLVKLDETGTIQPLLAESWTVSEDGLTYTFALTEATFHNGEAFTSADVVYTINSVIAEDSTHPFKTTFAPIESVEAPDDRTAVLNLSAPSANLLFFMTQGQGVIRKESAAAVIATEPIGTGPFTFVSHTPGDSIVLEKNAEYWGTPALLDKVTYRYINNPTSLSNAMLSGDIDILAGVSAPELLWVFQGDNRFVVYEGLTNGQVTLAINAHNAPLDDLRVRQAISYAIDRQAIIEGAYAGYGLEIGSHTTPLDPYYVDLTEVYAYDPEKATELLTDAGLVNEDGTTDIELRLYLPPVSYARRGGEVVASQLAQVGITVLIRSVEWGVWLQDVFSNDDYDLSIVAHVEPRDIGQYGNPDYYWAYDNPDVAALLAQADAEPDETTRNELYGDVQRQITADAANGWLFLLPALSVTKQGITGYVANAPGLALDVTQLAFNP